MNRYIYCPTLKLTWSEVAELIGGIVQKEIKRPMQFKARSEDSDYWGFSVSGTWLTVAEIYQLLELVDHDEETRSEAIPSDDPSSRSIGMSLSRKLLKLALNMDWSEEHVTSDTLWLINISEEAASDRKDTIKIAGRVIDMAALKSKDELLKYFQENAPTHSALMDFCEDYRNQYGNELCWPYPISDGKHLGTFLVLVKEGVLSLPYDDADKIDYELFCMDDVSMFDAESMDVFIDDWNSFNEDLLQAMYSMKNYLKKQEVRYESKN